MRRPTVLELVLLFAVLLAPGCGWRHLIGTPIAAENIPQIAVGKTTRADVFRLFGAPFDVERKEHHEVLRYLHGKEAYWTVGFYSEREETADVLTIYLDQNGIVTNYAFSKDTAIPESFKRPQSPGPRPTP